MTTTAFDDQFTAEPEHVTHQPYDVVAILRQNAAYLERELQRQRERADKAEATLKAAREQEPIKYLYRVIDCFGHDVLRDDPKGATILETIPLYASPIPAPAPAVPDGDDFNGTTPHLIQCMEALVRLDADGVLVPHGIGRDASKLLSAAANRLRKQTAPSVPEEWREVMAELAADLQACIEAEHAYRDQYSSVMRKYQNDMRIVERARALLQSAEVKT